MEAPPSEQWGGMVGNGYANTATTLWRQSRNQKAMGAPPFYPTEDACIYTENVNWREHDAETGIGIGGAIATPHGTISLRLHNKIRVDMTIDRAVRVLNFKVRNFEKLNYE